MKSLSRRAYALAAIALGVVLFVAVNIVSNTWLGAARLDLTSNGLYSVSPGTRSTLGKLEEPVTLRFYFDFSTQTPLILALFAAFAAGAFFGVVALLGRVLRQRREISFLRRKGAAAEPAPPAMPPML